MEKVEKVPTTSFLFVLRLLIKLGAYAEEIGVSDTYLYRDMRAHGMISDTECANKFKLDGKTTSITTRTNPNNNYKSTTSYWDVTVADDKWPTLSCNYYRIYRVNKDFIKEIIAEIEKGNRKNYTKDTSLKATLNVFKKNEKEYDKYRIATLNKLQYVIKETAAAEMLEEQARKLQQCRLLAV